MVDSFTRFLEATSLSTNKEETGENKDQNVEVCVVWYLSRINLHIPLLFSPFNFFLFHFAALTEFFVMPPESNHYDSSHI